MKRTELNFIIDALAFACATLLAATGLILYFLLPAGTGSYLGIWNLSRHQWGEIHLFLAFAALMILGIHLFLHRSFLKAMLFSKGEHLSRKRLFLTAIALIVLAVVSLAPFITGTSPLETPRTHMRMKLKG